MIEVILALIGTALASLLEGVLLDLLALIVA